MPLKKNTNFSLISVVIPAYKQEKTIKSDIKNIVEVLNTLGYKYEVIVVIDGIVDNTHKEVLKVKSGKVKVIAYDTNQGKGQAVRIGMMHAKGDIIGFIDSGMDINPAGFMMLLNHMEWYNADVIVGSKLHPVSKVSYPMARTILSWGYRFLTQTLFGFKIKDTQVGLKFFKKEVIKKVLPRLLVKQFAFDIELLAVSYALGYKRIYEAPIEINFNSSSTTIMSKRLWYIVALMIWDTLAVFYRLRIRRYYTSNRSKKVKKRLNPSLRLKFIS
jgi:glycosyltransferase involved in cell wall biosynthesis